MKNIMGLAIADSFQHIKGFSSLTPISSKEVKISDENLTSWNILRP